MTIVDREALEVRFTEVETVSGANPQRPVHWGGYRLVPDYFEFWQGRRSRLHDRIAYRLLDNGRWERERLQPWKFHRQMDMWIFWETR